ncbi:unnamed protein product [Brugia timori]|jgi:hypothetical protein|uniref:Uncharacterized protein n=1 Tax=Brugia timori TaxID=42155 RepID=A0A0R3Q5A9_9BILA|nr:unnamed protein product [Brugia timori]
MACIPNAFPKSRRTPKPRLKNTSAWTASLPKELHVLGPARSLVNSSKTSTVTQGATRDTPRDGRRRISKESAKTMAPYGVCIAFRKIDAMHGQDDSIPEPPSELSTLLLCNKISRDSTIFSPSVLVKPKHGIAVHNRFAGRSAVKGPGCSPRI